MWIPELLLPAAMFGLMFGMGLTLTLEDFRRIALAPAATLLGTLLQLVAMPIAGIAIALSYGLPPLLAAGLVIIAACPGGMFSNLYVYLGRANTALSITLTATATMVTLFTMPLWVRAILANAGDADASIDVPVLESALRLGGLTVLPVTLGMGARSWRPGAVSIEKWLSRICAAVIVGGVTWDGLRRPELPVAEFQVSLLPALWLVFAAIALGLGLPALLRLSPRDATTIAVELVVKNVLLGLVLARQSLAFEATIPIFAFGAFQTPVGVLVLVGWRLLARYGVVAGVPSRP